MKNYLFLLILLLTKNLLAQDDSSRYIITKKTYSVEDGLASREVFCGIQDHDGFMWFGTRNGLNRFDGKHFKLYTKQQNGLAENRIIQLAIDQQNRLFIVYGHPGYARSVLKVDVMDLKTHEVKSLKETFPNLPFDENYVYWVANGGRNICFLVSKPFQYWQLNDESFQLKYEMKAWDKFVKNPSDLLTSHGGYHTTTGRLCQFQQDYAALFLTNIDPIYLVTPSSTFGSDTLKERGFLGINNQHELILSTHNGVDLITPQGVFKENVTKFKPPLISEMWNIYFRRTGGQEILAYSIKDGLYLYDYSDWRKIMNLEELKIPSGEGLYGMYKDNQQNFWIFTAAQLIKVKINKNPFEHLFTKTQLKSRTENQVRGIYADTSNNVFANSWTNFAIKKSNSSQWNLYDDNEIKYASFRYENKIYIGKKTSLYSYDLLTQKFECVFFDVDLSEIWAINSFQKNTLLIGCSDTIFNYNLNTKKITPLEYASPSVPKISFIYRFFKGKDQRLWAVAQNGLFELNQDGTSILDNYSKQQKNESKQLPFEILLDTYLDQDGYFWFATSGEGLYRWGQKSNSWMQFNITSGLPSDILYRIEADDYGNLWISSDYGLIRFNRKTFRVTNYNTSDGLSHNEFNRTSSFKSSIGKLYFGGLDGVNAFNPSDFLRDTNDSKIPLQIISYNKFSGEANQLLDLTDELLSSKKIVLEPNDKLLNLEFQLLEFDEGKLNYAYRIDGIDKDWNYIDQNSIRISGLPFGEYMLRIKGQSKDGQWSKHELSIPLIVLAPLYKKWWFIIGGILTTILSVAMIFKWRTNQLRMRKNALEKTVAQRTVQLKNSLAEKEVLLKEIHHRVKNNLQVVISLLNLQQAKHSSEELSKSFIEAKSNVRSISLIHENLYRHENLSGVEFKTFVSDLFNQVNEVYNPSKENIHFIEEMNECNLDIDTAVPLGLILNELFTNSYKYARQEGKELSLAISLKANSNHSFNLEYSDNGPGLSNEINLKKSTTMGMNLMKDLSRQIGGSIEYTFNKGSHFIVHFLTSEGRKAVD